MDMSSNATNQPTGGTAEATQQDAAPEKTAAPAGSTISSSEGTSSSENKRVNVIFSPEQYATLENIAKTQQISLSDALRQAISVSDMIVKANEDKNTQILIKKGDTVQELKIVR
jgi:hypothetical protein